MAWEQKSNCIPRLTISRTKGVRSDVDPSLITLRNVRKLINKGSEEKSIYILACDFPPLGCFPEVVDRLSIVGKRCEGSRNWSSCSCSCTRMHRNLGKLGRQTARYPPTSPSHPDPSSGCPNPQTRAL